MALILAPEPPSPRDQPHDVLLARRRWAVPLARLLAPGRGGKIWAVAARMLEAGGPALAIPAYVRAVHARPTRARWLARLGRACLDAGRAEEAVAALALAVRLRSDIPKWRFLLSLAHERAGSTEAAVKTQRAALRLSPDSPRWRDRLARLESTLHDPAAPARPAPSLGNSLRHLNWLFAQAGLPPVAADVILPRQRMRQRARERQRERQQDRMAARRVEAARKRMLEHGFAQRGLAEMTEWAEDATDRSLQRRAAFELLVWHVNRGTAEGAAAALRYADSARHQDMSRERAVRIALLAAEARHALNDADGARATLIDALEGGWDPGLALGLANLEPATERRLVLVSEILDRFGLEAVRLHPDRTGSPFDRLDAPVPAAAPDPSRPLISVIMPAYNAEAMIATAIRSILAQSWPTLELLVVDDCSTDGTAGVVAALAAADPRVRLIRAPVNRGAYVARNLALAQATGTFVTCHDTDDWSHPRKLERQATHLLANPATLANMSICARTTEDLRFARRSSPGGYLVPNASSLMFRRAPVLDRLGCWDSVRFGADTEFIRRLVAAHGPGAVAKLERVPLSFVRLVGTSLTHHGAFGVAGFLFGARRAYRLASDHHHRTAGSLRFAFPQTERPFPVPAPMLPDRVRTSPDARRHLDVILAADLHRRDETVPGVIDAIRRHRRAGRTIGLVQMARYDADPDAELDPAVLAELRLSGTELLVYGEHVACDLLLIQDPRALDDHQLYVPDIHATEIRALDPMGGSGAPLVRTPGALAWPPGVRPPRRQPAADDVADRPTG